MTSQLDLFDHEISNAIAEIKKVLEANGGFIRFVKQDSITPSSVSALPLMSIAVTFSDIVLFHCEAIRLNSNDEIECFLANQYGSHVWITYTDDEMKSLDDYENPWYCLDWDGMDTTFVSNLYEVLYKLADMCY